MSTTRQSPEFTRLLTPAEVAAMFRVDPKTVTRWAKDGKLTSVRTLGGHRRYPEAEVRALLDQISGSALPLQGGPGRNRPNTDMSRRPTPTPSSENGLSDPARGSVAADRVRVGHLPSWLGVPQTGCHGFLAALAVPVPEQPVVLPAPDRFEVQRQPFDRRTKRRGAQ